MCFTLVLKVLIARHIIKLYDTPAGRQYQASKALKILIEHLSTLMKINAKAVFIQLTTLSIAIGNKLR